MKFKNDAAQAVEIKKTKIIMLLIIAIAILLLGTSCKKKDEKTDDENPIVELNTTEASTSPAVTFDPNYDPATVKMGLIMAAKDGELSYAAMHGFLRSAENLGYPAKLYTAPTSEEAAGLVDKAISDGCKGVLIWADSAEMLGAISTAKNAGLKVIVPFVTVGEDVADANFYQDESDYTTEAARILIERIRSRGKNSGNIYITGVEDHEKIVENFETAIRSNYPSYKLIVYDKKSKYDEVYKIVENDPEIVALIVLEVGSGEIWNEACNNVQSDLLKALKPTPAPSPNPTDDSKTKKKKETASPSPSPTPEIVNEALEAKKNAAKRYVNILLLDYTEENLGLVERGVVTGLIARPFYDSAAQSVYVMDRLFRGLPTQTHVLLNVPIIRKGYTAKYKGVMNEVHRWFNLETVKSEPVISPSPDISSSPTTSPEISPSP